MSEQRNFKGEIVDQRIVKQKNNDYAVVLSVRVLGTENDQVVEAWGNFGQNADKTYTFLRHLGFKDIDFSKLDPTSEDFFPLKGKLVDLYRKDNTDGRTFWNINVPKKVNPNEVLQYIKENKEFLVNAANGTSESSTPF